MATKRISELSLRSDFDATCNLPVDDTLQSFRVTGQQVFDYVRGKIPAESYEMGNLALVSSVGSSALTIALKTKALANPSSTDPVRVAFRNATLATGDFAIKEITAATSLVISSGSTLGQVSGQPSRIWIYLLDAGTSPELAVSSKRFSPYDLVSTTAEGGAGAADSRTVMYSTTARSNVTCRLIGYLDNTQATAGTWASAGDQLQLLEPGGGVKNPLLTIITSGSSTYYPLPGARRLRIRGVGGGGGGGGSAATSGQCGVGGGGGGGGYFELNINDPVGSYSYGVGAAGSASSSGNNPGGNGGATTFGAATANGGTGGTGSATFATGNYGGGGGAGGTASGGDVNVAGMAGQRGPIAGSTLGHGGRGGNSVLGMGASENVLVSSGGAQAGGTGQLYGGGGSGGISTGTNTVATTGGAGAAGILIIEEYY